MLNEVFRDDAISRRYEVARRLDSSREARHLALAICEFDPVFFINNFCLTYDPRDEISLLPFELFDCQEQAINEIWQHEQSGSRRRIIFEKSRDMGATWICAAYAVHRWLFRSGTAIAFGSRKLDLVDVRNDPKCIFDKVRTIIDNLPQWLLNTKAPGYSKREHDHYCKIYNPANKSTITGEGGDNIGRGGRTTIYFVDEAAFLDNPDSIDRALSHNARMIVYVSTPHGMNNPFAVKRHSGNYPIIRLHWTDDPRKNYWVEVSKEWQAKLDEKQELILNKKDIKSKGTYKDKMPDVDEETKVIYPYYEQAKILEDEITIAQEYDIDYTASLEGVVIPPKWLRACFGLELEKGSVSIAGYDPAGEGENNHGFVAREGGVITHIEQFKKVDQPGDGTLRIAERSEEIGVKTLFYDIIGVGSEVAVAMRLRGGRTSFAWAGINVGQDPTKTVWPDGETSKEKCHNLKAELWWRLRNRVWKTYQFVENNIYYPPDELLSIPKTKEGQKLFDQLTNVIWHQNEAGKIIMESKKQMQVRGAKSPDLGDACVLAFAPYSLFAGQKRKSKHTPTQVKRRKSDIERTKEIGKKPVTARRRRKLGQGTDKI